MWNEELDDTECDGNTMWSWVMNSQSVTANEQ